MSIRRLWEAWKILVLLYSGQKKVFLFPEIGLVKFFLSHTTRIVECVSEYVFLISKNKQAYKKINKNTKETKEERKKSPENRLKNKFAAARVKIFLATLISWNKSIFLWLQYRARANACFKIKKTKSTFHN